MALEHVNAVVVGAGAGGGVVAKELSEAGLRVVLLERGEWPSFDEPRPRRADQPAHHGRSATPSAPTTSAIRASWSAAQRQWRIVLPSEGGYSNNAACVGSRHGQLRGDGLALHAEKDFRMRSTYGALEGSTLEDWPITYDDLEPCYEKAEWEIGVSGDDGRESVRAAAPQAAARCRRFPYNREGRILEAGREAAWAPSVPHPDAAQHASPTAAARRACAAVTASASPARSTPSAAPRTPSSRGASRPATASCAPAAWPARWSSTSAGAPAA